MEHKTFTQLRQQVAAEWTALPKTAQVVSKPLQDKVAAMRKSKHL